MSAPPLIPVGPSVPPDLAAILKSHEDAIRELQIPTAPAQLAHVATKALLPPAADHHGGYLICGEINSIVHSSLVATTWTWLRADGSAL